MTEEINFGNDLDVKTEDFEFDYIKGDDSDFQVEASFRRMTDYCDRIQLVKITDDLNSKDFVCKMEESEDEIKTNEEIDDFFVYNFGLDQRPRQKARSRFIPLQYKKKYASILKSKGYNKESR